MVLIELSNYTLNAEGAGNGLKDICLALAKGDSCSVQSDSMDDAHVFIKALATLVAPQTGTYRYKGEIVDFSDYRNLLPVKKKIGYIGQNSAMISNRTVRENLLLTKSFFNNSLSLTLDDNIAGLCEIFKLENKLDVRPGDLQPVELRMAIAVRELTKSFDVLLLERPEDYFGYNQLDLFSEILEDTLEHGHAVVFFSNDQYFTETFSNRKLLIDGGTLTSVHP